VQLDSSCGAGGWYSTGTQEFRAFTSIMAPLFATQAPFRLTSVHGVAGVPLKLTTSGGSGAGKLRFSAEDGPCEVCVVTGDVLRATNEGLCRDDNQVWRRHISTDHLGGVSQNGVAARRHVTVDFGVNSSTLSSAAKSELAALSKKLVERASVTVTGYAKGNANLAKSRATAVASYLSNKDDTHGTVKTVTTVGANSATVVTTKQ